MITFILCFPVTINVEENAQLNEIYEILDKNIPVNYRQDYLKLRYGAKIKKNRKQRIKVIIKEILARYDLSEYGDWVV